MSKQLEFEVVLNVAGPHGPATPQHIRCTSTLSLPPTAEADDPQRKMLLKKFDARRSRRERRGETPCYRPNQKSSGGAPLFIHPQCGRRVVAVVRGGLGGEFGRIGCVRLGSEGFVPSSIYGHGIRGVIGEWLDPKHISLHEQTLANAGNVRLVNMNYKEPNRSKHNSTLITVNIYCAKL